MPLFFAALWEAIVAGIPWLIGYFTVTAVTDHLGATADDKEKLLAAVAKQCKELNLSPAQCSALMSQTQKESSESNLADTIKWGLLAFFGIQIFNSTKR